MGGGDKCLAELGGKTLLQLCVDVAAPQVSQLVLNTNSDPGQFVPYGLPIVRDVVGGFAGPLAGVLTGLETAATYHGDITHVVSLATDAPFLPLDLVMRLCNAVADGAEIAQARSNGRRHPVFAIWPVALAPALRRALVDDGLRKIDDFTSAYKCAIVDFEGRPDPFTNVNTPDDFAQAEAVITG